MTFRRDYKTLNAHKPKTPARKKQQKQKYSIIKKINALFLLILITLLFFYFQNSTTKTKKTADKMTSEAPSNNAQEKLINISTANKPPVWKYIVIHHSGIDIGDKTRYKKFHKAKYKSDNLLYHFLIGNGFENGLEDGKIEIADRWKKQQVGGHVTKQEYNDHGIGIALVGNLEEHPPTKRQMASLLALVQYLMGKFNISASSVLVHKEVNATECPGKFFPINSLRKHINKITLAKKLD